MTIFDPTKRCQATQGSQQCTLYKGHGAHEWSATPATATPQGNPKPCPVVSTSKTSPGSAPKKLYCLKASLHGNHVFGAK